MNSKPWITWIHPLFFSAIPDLFLFFLQSIFSIASTVGPKKLVYKDIWEMIKFHLEKPFERFLGCLWWIRWWLATAQRVPTGNRTENIGQDAWLFESIFKILVPFLRFILANFLRHNSSKKTLDVERLCRELISQSSGDYDKETNIIRINIENLKNSYKIPHKNVLSLKTCCHGLGQKSPPLSKDMCITLR